MDFEEHLHGGRRVVVAFAGGPQNVYQFGRLLARLGTPHVLMRDSTQKLHQHGVAGIGDFLQTATYIARLRRQYGMVTTVGVSSGSYSALLYGQMIGVDEVVAVSPLSTRTEVDDFDPRWHSQIVDPNQADAPDLRHFFRNGPIPHVRAYVSDGEATELDRQMATRIGITDITLVPGYSHSQLARGMRDHQKIFDWLLSP